MNLDVQRAEIISQLLATGNPEVLTKVQHTLKRLQNNTEEETEYISKEEVMNVIREGLIEMFFRVQRTGNQLRLAEELINEL